MKKIHCFLPYYSEDQVLVSVTSLRSSGCDVDITVLVPDNSENLNVPDCRCISVSNFNSTATLRCMAGDIEDGFVLISVSGTAFVLGEHALIRLTEIAGDTGAAMCYADSFRKTEAGCMKHPVIDYQAGSLRDDFDFGSLLLFPADVFKRAVAAMKADYRFAGIYDLRLRVSRMGELVHIAEYLYTEEKSDYRKSGEKQFDYVDPRNREVQIEMEQVCTEHLQKSGAWLPPRTKGFCPVNSDWPVTASVIIPVYNRVRTIGDAVRSALAQHTDFPFNVIVIDNHSDDGTGALLEEMKSDERLIHLIPDRDDLGIGGCWNTGIFHPACGKFAVQLDSDDLYKDKTTLQTMIDAFSEQQCAMVVGSYIMTDFDMQVIPPGLIDHREWTPENGHNNALRINGLGAPRAFYTELLRRITVPNTSYGEDYALGLIISRNYRIGRVYTPVYLCRRWEGNSDAALNVGKVNANNLYKDKLRTYELAARIKMNADGNSR